MRKPEDNTHQNVFETLSDFEYIGLYKSSKLWNMAKSSLAVKLRWEVCIGIIGRRPDFSWNTSSHRNALAEEFVWWSCSGFPPHLSIVKPGIYRLSADLEKALCVLQLPKIREFKLLAKKVVEKHWILGSVYVFSATFLRRHWKSDKIKQLWATSYHFSSYFYTLAGVIMEPWMNPT